MKLTLKRISVLICLLCFSILGLCACGEEEAPALKDPVTYTATVTLEDGTPVEGVKLKWGDNGPYTTDKDGVATATLEKGTYTLTLDESSLPEGTSVSGSYTVTAKLPKTSVVLSSEAAGDTVLYTVKVLKPDGTPYKGAKVGLCKTGEACTFFENATGDDGTASQKLEKATYNVQLLATSIEGYTYDIDNAEHRYYTGAQATPENTTVIITLKQA